MSIKCFASGSCRLVKTVGDGHGKITPIHSMFYNFVGCNFLAKLHTPKQHLQLLKYIRQDIEMTEEERSHFLTGSSFFKNTVHPCGNIEDALTNIRKEWEDIDVFIFEICSLKTYTNTNGTQETWELRSANATLCLETDKAYEESILELVEYVRPKKVVLMCHVRPHLYGQERMESRERIYGVLKHLEEEQGIAFVDPSDVVAQHGAEIMIDRNHFNERGRELLFDRLYEKITQAI